MASAAGAFVCRAGGQARNVFFPGTMGANSEIALNSSTPIRFGVPPRDGNDVDSVSMFPKRRPRAQSVVPLRLLR